jgi:hypothetical protein
VSGRVLRRIAPAGPLPPERLARFCWREWSRPPGEAWALWRLARQQWAQAHPGSPWGSTPARLREQREARDTFDAADITVLKRPACNRSACAARCTLRIEL